MLPLTRSRNRSRFFPPFSPASLFSAGEQGAWYDPSDFSTLFTDSAGTTPVTAVEQFVGLMLDKSKGLVLGSELVTNANTASSWAVGGTNTATQDGSAVKITYVDSNVGALVFLNNGPLSGNLTAGKRYKVSFEARCDVGNSINIVAYDGSTTTSTFALTASYQTFTVYLYFVSGTPYVGRVNDGSFGAGESYWVRNITVRELPGNHATQTTSAKRPKLAARYNLLTYTEQFDNAAWTKSGLNAFGSGSVANTTATTDPLGGNTADYIQENTATSAHLVIQAATVGANVSAVFSIYAKAAERTFLLIYPESSAGAGAGVWFNLSTGAVGTQGSGRTGSITSVGNGWYRCTVTCSIATADYRFYAGPASADNVVSYAGTGTSGIYIWGADLRPTSQAMGLIGPTYQRVVDAATYDAVGFLPYLQFDGIDDSMSTGSIDFTATDKMTVWAGVRKQTDATGQILYELSASVPSNANSFAMYAGNNASALGAFWTSQNRGNGASAASELATTAAPTTTVLSVAHQIQATPRTVTKTNGAVLGTLTGVADTGNYGNYPLFIGARNNASLFFNGWLTSLIVRGAQSTQGQIEATESWVNGKTGAY
jgi:hypothetical protein